MVEYSLAQQAQYESFIGEHGGVVQDAVFAVQQLLNVASLQPVTDLISHRNGSIRCTVYPEGGQVIASIQIQSSGDDSDYITDFDAVDLLLLGSEEHFQAVIFTQRASGGEVIVSTFLPPSCKATPDLVRRIADQFK